MSCGVYIYGDSLMKATMPDQAFRYHFHLDELRDRYRSADFALTNRAKMGATVSKGRALVAHDVGRGLDARYALVAYGGNDSDFDWAAVAAEPEREHKPRTELSAFRRLLGETVDALTGAGVQPVLMTLPPIDAERYLGFICREGLSRSRILQWLGDVQRIYRYQEAYSETVAGFAAQRRLPLIDVRRPFLLDRQLPRLIAADGIHLTMPGYVKLYDILTGWLRQEMGGTAT
ncbi:MAG: SGNH/GDSL hydrolase family protein [Ruminococcaceae bacterium]|jgi:lysophospholipase L1-like esterase|nr:SGNH/GDSL hydrolase family protein [Oscillospiraceae bacterium]